MLDHPKHTQSPFKYLRKIAKPDALKWCKERLEFHDSLSDFFEMEELICFG